MDDNLDQQLRQVIGRWHRARWAAVGVLAAVILAALGLGARQLQLDQARLAASCDWYRDLGTAPISTNTPTHQPSQLGVRLIVDARLAWEGQGCPGTLPPASPALRHWAAVFHIASALQ